MKPYALLRMCHLQQLLGIGIDPVPGITSLFNASTAFADSPESLGNRSRIVKIEVWEAVLDGIGGSLRLVMGDC